MKLEVMRFSSQNDSTLGILFDVSDGNRKFLCYTIEDEYRAVKKMHETRIPEGTYKLSLREEGGFHKRYLSKYGANFHKGMIYVNNVTNFEYVLWHIGNYETNTSGCLLLGNSQTENISDKKGYIGASEAAYKRVYPIVRDAILSGEKVEVTYVDFDYVEGKPTPKVKPVKPNKPYNKANAQGIMARMGGKLK